MRYHPGRFQYGVHRMTDRGEKRILWLFVMLVGAGLCAFALSAPAGSLRIGFLPAGIAVIAFAFFRLRQLSRHRARTGRMD
jgi:hypothetical protein